MGQSQIWAILALLGLAERRFWHKSPNLGKSWDFTGLLKINENQRKSMKINETSAQGSALKAQRALEREFKAQRSDSRLSAQIQGSAIDFH